MRDVRNILSWLGMAEEQSILKDARKHVEETYKTVAYFADAVKAFIKGDFQAKTEAIANVREGEHKADVLKAKMVEELSKGLLLPPDREDLMHFANTLDKIADWTNGSARLLAFIDKKMPDSILSNMAIATNIIVNSTAKLKDAIESVAKNDIAKALEDCAEVDRFEHEADDQKKTLIEAIIHAELDPASLMLAYHLAEYMEGVTDKIEDAADFIKILAVKSK
jgi:uncharacterized protein